MGDGETECVTDQSAATRTDSQFEPSREVDPELVAELRAFETNTAARYGTVLDTLVVDYDDGATVESVREAVVAGIEQATSADDPRDLLVASGETVLSESYQGTNVLLAVELPDGHVFVDRIPVPRNPEATDGAYAALTETYGDLELLPQLVGEQVPIEYTGDRWRVALETSDEPTLHDRFASSSRVRAGLAVGAVGLVALGWAVLQTVSPTPTVGAFSPQSILTGSLAVLTVVAVANAVSTLGGDE